jgi:hypothetical protein
VTEERLAHILINGVPLTERVSDSPSAGLSLGTTSGVDTGRGGGGSGSGHDSGNQRNLNKKVSVFLNRLLLRIYSVPSLMTYLTNVQPVVDSSKGDGAVKIQLDFLRLPAEIMPQLQRLLAAPGKIKWYQYVRNGQARMGAEIPVDPKELKGDDYDYAY